jgi:hypothetical protein
MTDASLTISLINLLGSLANEILFKSKIKKKKNYLEFSH